MTDDLLKEIDNFNLNDMKSGAQPSVQGQEPAKKANLQYDQELDGLLSNDAQKKEQAQIQSQGVQNPPIAKKVAAPVQVEQITSQVTANKHITPNPFTKNVELSNVETGRLQVLEDDPYLQPYENDLKLRQKEFNKWLKIFQDAEGGILNIGRSYNKYGLINKSNGDQEYTEWAPGAKSVSIFGDFNNWNREEFRCKKNEFGCHSITLKANADGTPRIKHNTKYKINIEGPNGDRMDRNSAWSKYQIQDKGTNLYDCVQWDPAEKYVWKHKRPIPQPTQSDRIYESHVGMAQEFGRVSSYRDFADHNLPRIKEWGYNVVQLMAIQEHSYYASFGYHVTGFFAISSRSGTPDDFKYLVDTAHSLGIKIIIDLVHSHASNNVNDGINKFDGTDHSYSLPGERGYHSGWDSMLFDYSKYEVKRFLLANLAWLLDEYNIDGFRFDAVTSILYQHHGIGVGFSGNYAEYFGLQTDLEGIVYLLLANTLIREITPDALTIAEDVSGMPTLCRSIADGGLGFDYRLSMFMPDMWIKLLKGTPDESWNMGHITHSLTDRRWKEKVVGYAESHDQAIVGDKTISMWLFDADIYTGMSRLHEPSLRVSRGMGLHKMIRLLSQSLGGQAYLNFMGNEFGHPEWIDFPREGNNNSYNYCRRQWNLLYDENLRYGQLGAFDKVMNAQEIKFSSMINPHQFVTLAHEGDKIIAYEKGDLLYVFNFNGNQSFEGYALGTFWKSDHFILYESDADQFGGHKRLEGAHGKWFETSNEGTLGRPHTIRLYLPTRTCLVLCPYENALKLKAKGVTVPEMPQVTDRQRGQCPDIHQVQPQIVQQHTQELQNQIKQKEAQVKSDPAANDPKAIDQKLSSLLDDLN